MAVGSISPLAGSPKEATIPSTDSVNLLFFSRTGASSSSGTSSTSMLSTNLSRAFSRAATAFFGTYPLIRKADLD